MRYVSIFSGIEAATVAWEPLGWEPVCFAEFDEFPSAVLAERFPDVPNLGDVTKVNWKKYRGKCDLVVGGSPCQSFSIAGKREGLKGESGLMFEYVRAVREIRPRWFLWENVPGALSSERGEAFRCLLSEMDKLGYGLAWRVLDAQFFGVAQRRRRLFLVGRLGERPPIGVLVEPESLHGDYPPCREERARLAAQAGRGAESAGFKWNQGAGAGNVGYEDELSPTCTADWHNPAVFGFAQNSRDEVRIVGDGTVSGALAASPGMKQTTYVCETAHSGSNGLGVGEAEVIPTLDTSASSAVAVDSEVYPINEQVATCDAARESRTCLGIGSDGDPGFTIMANHPQCVAVCGEEPIAMADLDANTAIDVNMVGTLKVGGDAPTVCL